MEQWENFTTNQSSVLIQLITLKNFIISSFIISMDYSLSMNTTSSTYPPGNGTILTIMLHF